MGHSIMEHLAHQSMKLVCIWLRADEQSASSSKPHSCSHWILGIGWCHCNAIQPMQIIFWNSNRKRGSSLNFLPFQQHYYKSHCSSRSRWIKSPIGWAECIAAGIIVFPFKTKIHMQHLHLVSIYGDNSVVCSIHLLSVLFLGAETI